MEKAFIKFGNGINGIISPSGGDNLRVTGTRGSVAVSGNGSSLDILNERTGNNINYLTGEHPAIHLGMSGRERAFHELEQAVALGRDTALSSQPNEIELNQNILLCIIPSSLRWGIRLKLSDVQENFTVTGKFGDLYV